MIVDLSLVGLHMIGSDILKMLRAAFGFHVVIKWHAPAALHLNWSSLFCHCCCCVSNVTEAKDSYTAVGVLYVSTSALCGCSIGG